MNCIAFLVISPLDKGPSLSDYVKAAVDVIRKSGVKYQVTSMGTIVEAEDPGEVFRIVQEGVDAVKKLGSSRVSVSVKLDCRYDKEATMESKVQALEP